jgi:hypothetical protein
MDAKQLYQKCYDLAKWLYPAVNRFPKSQRLILSQRVEALALGVLGGAIRLNYADSKIVCKNMLVDMHKLQTLLRLSKDLSWLSLRQYEHVSGLLSEIFAILKEKEAVHENLQEFIR